MTRWPASGNARAGLTSMSPSAVHPEEGWSQVIRPRRPLFDWDARELWAYRDLVLLLVKRDFVTTYKQTILGPLWLILAPLLSTALYAVLFNRIARLPTAGAPPILFYLAGLVLWTYFSGALSSIATAFLANAHLMGKVYFPRLVVPLAMVISHLLKLAIQLVLLLACLLYYHLQGRVPAPGPELLLVAVLPLLAGLHALGFGTLVSGLTVRYRDLQVLLQFGLQLWMYATPVIYPLELVPAEYRWVALLNPMCAVVEGFRHGLGGAGALHVPGLAYSLACGLLVCTAGLAVFHRAEQDFVDSV